VCVCADSHAQGAADPVLGGSEPQPPSAEEVAVLDPVEGFLLMDPLPRCCFILSHLPHTEAQLPVLALLSRCAQNSAAAALAVARCPGMAPALAALLRGAGGVGAAAGSGSGSSGNVAAAEAHMPGVSGDGAAASHGIAQGTGSDYHQGSSAEADAVHAHCAADSGTPPVGAVAAAAMRLARLLCQASPTAMRHLQEKGVLVLAQEALALGSIGGCNAPGVSYRSLSAATPEQHLLSLEALRTWRVAAAQVWTLGSARGDACACAWLAGCMHAQTVHMRACSATTGYMLPSSTYASAGAGGAPPATLVGPRACVSCTMFTAACVAPAGPPPDGCGPDVPLPGAPPPAPKRPAASALCN
jgi:hypothetical protein